MRVKIYGAGSIGNHLAHASRVLGWDVLICDLDSEALERTKNEIYPGRYGKWDPAIRLFTVQAVPKEKFDVVVIGTPPENHMDLAIKAIKDIKPRLILVEKPMAVPSLERCQELYELAKGTGTIVCIGYNHVLGKNTLAAENILKQGTIGACLSLEAEFREYWGGIFKAHPWLSGPEDSYLGFSKLGGGALGEHSHAINLWQHFAHLLGFGRVIEVDASMDIVKDGKVEYDRACRLRVKTEQGFEGLVIQDVVTEPPQKRLRIQGENGTIDWFVGYEAGTDAVILQKRGRDPEKNIIRKSRPEDFILEMEHIRDILEGHIVPEASPLSLERGLDTMLVIAAAHLSNKLGRSIRIDYSKGYIPEALNIAT